MKLTLPQPDLVAALSGPTGIVENKNTIPILGHVLIMADDNGITVKATDLDIEAVTINEVAVDEQGAACVSGKLLMDIVKRLAKGKDVTLETDGYDLRIASGRSKFKLPMLPDDEFPQMASEEYAKSGTIDAAKFSAMLEKTKFAMSTEETRYYLNGVYLHNDDAGDLIAVATDGNRLAKMTVDAGVDVVGVIIPRKTVLELVRLLDGATGDVTIDTSETKIRVTGSGFSVTSKVVDGTFPDYTRVFPSDSPNVMTVDASEFSHQSSSVATVADDRSRGVKLSVSGDTCTLFVRGNTGEATAEVDVEYNGAPVDIGFNSKFLAEMMAQASNGIVTVKMKGANDPAVFTCDDLPEFLGVAMPMRL